MPTNPAISAALSFERSELVRREMPLDHQLYEITKPAWFDRDELNGDLAETLCRGCRSPWWAGSAGRLTATQLARVWSGAPAHL
jgi:hypothetical protein